jgi:2-polyprenyl-3-methyl-5-hydroxy-6-metoxy-1,4-benzoquinol methylase
MTAPGERSAADQREQERAAPPIDPERFDPQGDPGSLIAAEHLARYRWAAQAARGKRVLDVACGAGYGSAILAEAGAEVRGADVDPEAVRLASERSGGAAEFQEADIAALPYDDDSFDLVVCFETIEHVSDQAAALDELARVLAPGGLLMISSPNREVYPPGNPHHTHEYVPEELRDELCRRFSDVRMYAQHPWLASSVVEDEEFAEAPPARQSASTWRIAGAEGATYTLAVAGDAGIPSIPGVTTLGQSFEVRWWKEEAERLRKYAHDTEKLASQWAARETETRQRLVRTQAALLEAERKALLFDAASWRVKELEDAMQHMHDRRLKGRAKRALRPFKRRLKRLLRR